MGAFSKSIGYVSDLLAEIKFHIASEHLMDDSGKLASTVPKGIVICPTFRHLGIIISFESGVVFHNIVSCIHQSKSKYLGSSVGHLSVFGVEVP